MVLYSEQFVPTISQLFQLHGPSSENEEGPLQMITDAPVSQFSIKYTKVAEEFKNMGVTLS